MKKYLLVSLAALAATSVVSASGADLPSRKDAPFYAPPAATWTGFYAGLNAGYNAGTNADVSMEHYAGPWTTAPGGGTASYMVGPGIAMRPVSYSGGTPVFASVGCSNNTKFGSAPGSEHTGNLVTQGFLGGSGGLFGWRITGDSSHSSPSCWRHARSAQRRNHHLRCELCLGSGRR